MHDYQPKGMDSSHWVVAKRFQSVTISSHCEGLTLFSQTGAESGEEADGGLIQAQQSAQ